MPMTAQEVQKLYVAYFNRPADTLGLAFWMNSTPAAASAAFSTSAEYAATYAGMSNAQVVSAIYTNLFGRAAEPAGITYWGGLLQSGAISVSNAVTQIAGGAQGTDLAAYNSKVTAATAFTTALDTSAEIVGYSGTTANNAAKAWMNGITDAASATAATVATVLNASIGTVVAAATTAGGSTVALTTGVDNVPTSASQVVTGVDNFGGVAGGQTFNTGDTVSGASAVNILFSGNSTAIADINNTAAFNGTMLVDATINAQLFDGVVSVNNAGGGLGFGLTVTNGDIATTYGIKGDTSAADIVVGIRAAQTAGTADTVKFSVAGAGSTVSVAGASAITSLATLTSNLTGVENVSVATTGTNVFSVTAVNTALTDANKFIVTGNGSNTMTVSALTQVSEYDMSGSTGTNALNVAGTLTTGDIVKGGSGADTLRVNNATTIANLAVTGVETLRLSTGSSTGNMIFAADPAFTTIRVDGDTAEAGVQTLTGVGSAARVTYVGDGTTANAAALNEFNSLTVNNSYAGANDSVAVAIGNGGIVNTVGNTMRSLTLNGAENLNITVSDQAATSVTTFANLNSTTLTSVSATSAGSVVFTSIGGAVAGGVAGAAGALASLNLSGVAGTGVSAATLADNTVGAGTVVTAAAGGTTLTLAAEVATDSLTYTGAAGVDTIVGTVFTGIIIANGGAGNDSLTGGTNADVLTGGEGADALIGLAGADILTGGEGADTITGGAGADTIILSETTAAVDTVVFADTAANNGVDTITGFSATNDVLNLAAFETAGAEVLIAAGALTNVAATVYYLGASAAGNADSTTAAAAAITAGATWTSAAVTSFVVLSDDNSTSVYSWLEAGGAGAVAGELTLVATIGTAMTSAQLLTAIVI